MEDIFRDLVVVKRSGQRVSFNKNKIAIAVKQAFDSVYKTSNEDKVNKVYSKVLEYIKNNFSFRKTINVEDIQDIIENILKDEKYIEVYNVFNEYRVKRAASRDIFDKKEEHKFIRATEKLVLTANENENKSPSLILLNFGRTISDEFSRSYLIDSKYIRAHDEGLIYIHDLDYYALGTIKDAFIDFSNTNLDNCLQSIAMTILNFKKEQYKEQAIPSIDYLLSTYLIEKFKRKFNKTAKRYFKLEGFDNYINLKSIESLIYRLNTIYIDFSIFDKYLLNDKVIKIFNFAYETSLNDTKEEFKDNLKNLLVTLNNLSSSFDNSSCSISIGSCDTKDGKFIQDIYFEIISELDRLDNVTTVYKVKEDDRLEYISKLICLNKNIVVSFVNVSYNKLFLKNNSHRFEVEYFGNGDKITDNMFDKNQTSVGRMIVSKTSINLVRIALSSMTLDEFYNKLSTTLELVKNQLLQDFEYISSKYKENFKYIFESNYLIDNEKLEQEKKIRKVIKNGTLSIGYVGLYECLLLFDKKIDYAVEIIKFIKEKCDEFTNEYKLNFSLRETDEDEALKYLKALDKSIYGIIPKVTDKEYSIFSNNLTSLSFDERFKIERYIHKYSNGGYKEVVYLPKNYSYKKLYDVLELAMKYDIGYIKIKLGKC